MENVFFLFKYTHFSFKSNIQHSSVIYTDIFVLIRIFFSVFVVVLNETMEHLPVMYFCLSKLTDFNKRKVFHHLSLSSLSCQIETLKDDLQELKYQEEFLQNKFKDKKREVHLLLILVFITNIHLSLKSNN